MGVVGGRLTGSGQGARRLTRGLLAVAALTLLVLLALWVDASPLLRGPAPYPPEWQWRFHAATPAGGVLLAVCCALGLLALLASTNLRAVARHPLRAAPLVLTLATFLGVGLQLGFLELDGQGSAAELLVARTTSPDFTSHYTVAISPLASDVRAFLDHYAELLPHLPPHTTTHPPFAVLFYRAVLAVCANAPALTRIVVDHAALLDVDLARVPAQFHVLWVTALCSGLVIMLLTAATCWPIAALARALGASPQASLRLGLLWVIVPGPLLMVPELDQALALPLALATALLLLALSQQAAWAALLLALAAGLVAGCASLVSFGAIAFVAAGAGMVVAFAFARGRMQPHFAATLATAAASAAIAHLLPTVVGYDAIGTLVAALHAHHDSFTQRRSYPLWLAFNLWDFSVFLSVPVAALAGLGCARALGALRATRWSALCPLQRAQLALFAGLLVLDLTGAVRGEVGRIWIPLMPLFLVCALLSPGKAAPGTPTGADAEQTVLAPSMGQSQALALLLLLCAVVLRLRWQVP